VFHVLSAKGYSASLRWLQAPDCGATPEQLREEAITDLQDIEQCDLLVLCNDNVHLSTTGGMHYEAGFAHALGKRVIILGRRAPGNPFHMLMRVFERPEDIPEPRDLGF
jgi:nucleoside 2-deoxyribosyltransferase